MSLPKQERELAGHPAIVIGTPGRLWDLLNQNTNTDLFNALPKLKLLVLDEADRMVEIGHFKEMTNILNFIYSH
jgi:ATP-dependent RNA helicase DDX24/MAK5